ncbi:MAG: hypothetical protein PHV21_07545 [Synergistaceae bacterium]|jgi:endogenous inhibitor of DNA gyrase (YacG/DUF329 family)|nr:hypothetical protein [Synergistaceae bacterium]
MITSQKARISQMRLDGESYATIGDALGLSRNTVKSFCLRNSRSELNKRPASALTGTCAQCGMGFVLCPGHRQRRFCSDQCRITWWNAHRDLIKSKAKLEYSCACCGKHFMGYARQQRKFCSHACYIAHRYKKEHEVHE